MAARLEATARLREGLEGRTRRAHICFYAAPYGVVPEHLSETYPLSQYEIAEPLDHETIEFTAEMVREYVKAAGHRRVILVRGCEALDQRVEEVLSDDAVELKVLNPGNIWEKDTGLLVAEHL